MSMLTYPRYRRNCGWEVDESAPLNCSRLVNKNDCDSIIIGGGYTGLAIAKRLAELRPGDDIRVLDADTIGAGSSGRNSGFVLEHDFSKRSQTAASELYRHYRNTHDEMAAQVSLPDMASEVFKAAATPRGVDSLRKLANHLAASNQPFEILDANRVKEITGSDYYLSGVKLPGSRLLNPYTLVRALARTLPSNVQLHIESPALSIEYQGQRWKVNTPEGILVAPRVYLANNAFAKTLGVGTSYSVTIYTYAGFTAPLGEDELAQVTSLGQWGLLPANRLGSTLRTTDDGRLLIRSMYGYEHEGGDEVGRLLQRRLASRFPDLTGAQELEHWWGGTTSLTTNSAPLWGQLKPGLYASIGCNGVGILKGWMLGRELAQLSCGQTSLDIPGFFGKPGWMPPEPLRRLGFMAVSGLEKQRAGDEI